MAGNSMESPDEKELDERALPAETSDNSSRPHRERRKPDRYGSLAPDGSVSSKPISLPHRSQAADPSPTTTAATAAYNLEPPEEEEDTAAEEGEGEEEEITYNYARPESAAEEQSVQQPALPSEGGLRPRP